MSDQCYHNYLAKRIFQNIFHVAAAVVIIISTKHSKFHKMFPYWYSIQVTVMQFILRFRKHKGLSNRIIVTLKNEKHLDDSIYLSI